MGRNSYILCKHGAAATLERIITLLLRKTICKCIQIVDLFTSRNNVIHIYIVCIVFLLCILVQFSMILQQSSLFGGEQPLFLGVPWFSSHCPGKKNMVFLQLSPAFPHFSGDFTVGGGFKSIHEVQEVLGIFGKKVEPWQRFWPFSDNRVAL